MIQIIKRSKNKIENASNPQTINMKKGEKRHKNCGAMIKIVQSNSEKMAEFFEVSFHSLEIQKALNCHLI